MPTIYKDQFFRISPGIPSPRGTVLSVLRAGCVVSDGDRQINADAGETLDRTGVSALWCNDALTINAPCVGNIHCVGVTFYLANSDAPVLRYQQRNDSAVPVTPEHRMLLADWCAQPLMGSD
jgi:hypothetical protein